MAALLAAELALTLYAHPFSSVIDKAPLRAPGYEAAAVEVTSSLDGLARASCARGYDPRSAAGAPFGVNPDRSTPALVVSTAVLSGFGLSQIAAVNAFAWFGELATFLLVIATAFMARLSKLGIFTATALALALLNFDGLLRSATYDGPPLFVLACGLGLLALTSANRLAGNSLGAYFATAIAAALSCGFVHPGAPVFLAFGIVGLVAVHRQAKSRMIAALFSIAAAGIVGALPSIIHSLQAGVEPLGTAVGATPLHLLTDTLGLVADRHASGSASLRGGFRILALGGAIAVTVSSFRGKDDNLGLAVAVLLPSSLAYLGGLMGPLEHALPYRGLMLGLLGSCVLAGLAMQQIAESRQLDHLPRPMLLSFALVGAALVPRLAQDVGYFVPSLMPFPRDLPEEKPHIADMIGYGDIGYPRHRVFRHQGPPNDYLVVASKLQATDSKARRILVESPSLAQYLRVSTQAQIAGSLPWERLGKGADLFARFPKKDPTEAQLREYIETYAIGWIIVRFNPDPGDEDYRTRLSGMRNLLEPVPLRLAQHRVFKVRQLAPYLTGSPGEVELDGQTIRVTGTQPGAALTVHYHYQPRLQCRPDCRIQRLPLKADPMGLITIPAPHPADFEITAHP
jgi:hypothetical protein